MKQIVISILTIVFAISLAAIGTYADFSDVDYAADNLLQAGSLDLRLADADEFFGVEGDSVSETWYFANSYPPGMAPGDSLDSIVYLQNIGSTEATHLDIYCQIVNEELNVDTDAENLAENEILITTGGGIDNDYDGFIDEDDVDGLDNDGDGYFDEDPDPVTGPIPITANRGVYDKDRWMIVNYMQYQNTATIDIVWADGTAWDPTHIADVDGDGKITLFDFKHHGVIDLLPPVSGLASFSMEVAFGEASMDLNQYQGDRTQMVLTFALFQ